MRRRVENKRGFIQISQLFSLACAAFSVMTSTCPMLLAESDNKVDDSKNESQQKRTRELMEELSRGHIEAHTPPQDKFDVFLKRDLEAHCAGPECLDHRFNDLRWRSAKHLQFKDDTTTGASVKLQFPNLNDIESSVLPHMLKIDAGVSHTKEAPAGVPFSPRKGCLCLTTELQWTDASALLPRSLSHAESCPPSLRRA